MNTYYFVGGPLPGRMDEFRRRLDTAGGPPPGWLVLPHANGNGRALHVVHADSRERSSATSRSLTGSTLTTPSSRCALLRPGDCGRRPRGS